MIPEMDIVRDVPIILTSTNYEDTYDGDFVTRRAIIYTLSFVAKTYMYGPVTTSEVIKKVTVDQYAATQPEAPDRARQYTVSVVETAGAEDDDNFGFNETLSDWSDVQG
jgi:hypothetical protein